MYYNEKLGKWVKFGTSPVPVEQAHWVFIDQPERLNPETPSHVGEAIVQPEQKYSEVAEMTTRLVRGHKK